VTGFGLIVRDAGACRCAKVYNADPPAWGADVVVLGLEGGHEVDRWTVDFVHLDLARVA